MKKIFNFSEANQPSTENAINPGESSRRSSPSRQKKKRRRKKRKKTSTDPEVMTQIAAVKERTQPTLIFTCQTDQKWNLSANALLNMTLTFLRHVPEVKKIKIFIKKTVLK